MQVHIRQARIIDSRSKLHNKVADIIIENGKIASISSTSSQAGKGKTSSINVNGKEVWKGKELCVSPGWVDVFADYREPGYEQKETIASGLNAAATGGFTDVLLAPNTHPSISTKSNVQFVLQKAKGHITRLHPLGSATQNIEGKSLAEMLDMRGNGAVAFTDGWRPIQNSNLALKALEYVKAFNGVLIEIPIDTALAEGGLMHEGSMSTKLGMAGIPALAETLMIYRDIELVRYTASRLHITGVSTAEGIAMIRQAKKEGLPVTCSVTPYHLALTDKSLEGYNSLYKVSPPLRSEADRKALLKALNDGTIDCIASHHRPQEWDAKAREFEYAGDGMNIQEIAFNIIWQATGKTIDAGMLVNALSTKAREIFGLDDISIEKEAKAELTIFNTSESFTLQEDSVASMSRNNPFIGKQLAGKVIGIINQGSIHLNK
jgi:dihydroorotase